MGSVENKRLYFLKQRWHAEGQTFVRSHLKEMQEQLSREDNVTSETAIKIARAHETARQQIKILTTRPNMYVIKQNSNWTQNEGLRV